MGNSEARYSSGMFLLSPFVTDTRKALSNGILTEGYHQTGYAICDASESPLYAASVYVIGTVVMDTDRNILSNARLLQFISPDGGILWMSGYNKCKQGEYKYSINSGMNKSAFLCGELTEKGFTMERADRHIMLEWELSYWSDENSKVQKSYLLKKDSFKAYDKGYSFHGPHVNNSEIILNNGCKLIFNSQSGVLLSENENSPRHNATCFDRGISIITPESDSAVCDIMLLEDTDSDGDIVWLFHEWWYNAGPGRYEFIGGTGKWTGIQGSGTTTGIVRMRADDYWMPTWELGWNVL